VYQSYRRQKCFLGYSEQAEWTPDLLGACEEVLRRPEFDLEPDCAVWNFDAEVPLRQKVLELIANARYGIYDISCWRDATGAWHLPRNVLIELGMAIALNRPALLLRHLSSPEERLPACLAGLAGHVVCFAGETTLKRELEKRLPQWVQQPPEQSWWNRNCVVGGRRCEYREAHPRKEAWGRQSLSCLVADGPDVDREDFRAGLAEVLDRYRGVEASYLDALRPARGYDFLLCGLCQGVRSAPFGVFRITPQTSPEAFLVLGMSLALEAQFDYPIPKVVIVADEMHLPSLLRGYEVVAARNGQERETQLRRIVPTVLQKVRQTVCRSAPLPFTEVMLPLLASEDSQADQSHAHPAEEPTSTPPAQAQEESSSGPTAGAVVLVVDDSAMDQSLAGALIQKMTGWQATYASNGVEALKILATQQPDMVLMDLMMPEMDGLELLQQVRRQYPLLPVILVTPHGSEAIANQALPQGAASYVLKKNLVRDLPETLEQVLAASRARQEDQPLWQPEARAWDEFMRLYEPLLTSYVRARGVAEHDVEGIVQQLNISLGRSMPRVRLDKTRGRFRSWLYQLAANAVTDHFRKKGRRGKHEISKTENTPEPVAFDQGPDAQWAECERQQAYEQALEKVRASSQEASWACFERYFLANRTAEEVGVELGMLPNTVRKNASRILAKIREEAQAIQEELES
jgi:RNA polymerase sigma factor (sigma-70 family)